MDSVWVALWLIIFSFLTGCQHYYWDDDTYKDKLIGVQLEEGGKTLLLYGNKHDYLAYCGSGLCRYVEAGKNVLIIPRPFFLTVRPDKQYTGTVVFGSGINRYEGEVTQDLVDRYVELDLVRKLDSGYFLAESEVNFHGRLVDKNNRHKRKSLYKGTAINVTVRDTKLKKAGKIALSPIAFTIQAATIIIVAPYAIVVQAVRLPYLMK